jgi:hypothetical protein
VTGFAFLGTQTQCVNPLAASCLDISNQACPGGPLAHSCLPDNATFTHITTETLTLTGGNITFANVVHTDSFNATDAYVDRLVVDESLTCTAPGNQIAQDCFSLVNKTCIGGHLDSSCIAENQFLLNVDVADTLTINNLVCTGPTFPMSCLPNMILTIDGIEPDPGTGDFSIVAGTGIAIVPIVNGITIDNTGVTSVSLTMPAAEFVVTNPTVTTTGTFIVSKAVQQARYFFAGPLEGNPSAQPTFRTMDISDLPPLGANQIYLGDPLGSGAILNETLQAGTGISISYGTISNTGVTSVSLSLPNSVFVVTVGTVTTTGTLTATFAAQNAGTFFAGPSTGPVSVPTFRYMTTGDLPSLAPFQIFLGASDSSGTVEANLTAGTGISISQPFIGELLVSNTGVTSVSLSLPASIFTIMVPTVTTTLFLPVPLAPLGHLHLECWM